MDEQVGTFRTCFPERGPGSDPGRSSFELLVAAGECHRFLPQRSVAVEIVWAGSLKFTAWLGKAQFLLGNTGRPAKRRRPLGLPHA